ncbi:MAG TPA: hypothetical protein VM888_14225, partial [Chitinophagaceae bacterium]|nr:hypothetical protein [Chitinophagaceae bacterium]
MLTSKFTQMKSATKARSVLRAVRNIDPTAASAYTIEATLLLSNLSDGSTRSEKTVTGKYDGTANDAARKALDEGSRALLRELN